MKIVAVVVTYNRKDLLIECCNSILEQTLPVDKLIIIDNKSTDGTLDALEKSNILSNKKVLCKTLEKNIGGSGGFFEGMKIARNEKFDRVWIMDDDTIPAKDCLEKLVEGLKKVKEKVSFMASSIYGPNGEFMNVPSINMDVEKNGYQSWYKYLSKNMVSIKIATFVSILINGEAIEKFGLPLRDYFIWGDDTEYTTRIVKYYGKAYLVGDSIAIHKRKNASHTELLLETEKNRLKNYYYMYRNNLINT